MKKLALVISLLSVFSFVSAQAQTIVGEEGAKKSSDGKIIYPKEIENCEPCKRLWLANNQKHAKAAQPQATATPNNKGKASTTMKVEGN